MTRTEGILQNEEVEFLLKGDATEDAQVTTPEQTADVTMRGDIEQINLADIFQTLAMTKMVGRLRVRNAIEQRDIFFEDGMVRNFVPRRVETRRLGQRLIRAGVVSVDQMRTVLLEQKKSNQSIAQVLTAMSLVDDQTVAEISIAQTAEDLYAVFTWRRGTFEFYKGSMLDPQHLAELHAFEANGLLLEVARRSDEWGQIVKALHDPDEIPVCTDADASAVSEGPELDVLNSVDGRRSARELADSTLLGLFETCRVIKRLLDQGLVTIASPEQMLAAADWQQKNGESRRSIATLQTLWDRGEPIEPEVALLIASTLQKAGENRFAAKCLLQVATQDSDADRALDLARQARKLDARSVEALQFLHGRLTLISDPGDEYLEITGELADALTEEDKLDEALAAIAEIEALAADHPQTLARKARVLHRLGRGEEAIDVLLRLANLHKAEKRWDKLGQTYEQILKIDYRRKEVARALKALHANKLLRNLRAAAVGLAVALAVLIGFWLNERNARQGEVEKLTEDVRMLIARGDTDNAAAMLAQAVEELGTRPALESLQQSLAAAIAKADAERMKTLTDQQNARTAQATELFEKGDLSGALTQCQAIEDKSIREHVTRAQQAQLKTLITRLETLARELPFAVPPPVDPLQSDATRKQALLDLDSSFRESDRLQATGAARAQEPEFAQILTPDEIGRMVAAANTVLQAFANADERRTAYRGALAEVESARRLDPIFVAAREYAARHEFEKALQAYRRLAQEYRGEDDVRAHIREQVEHHAGIVRYLEVLDRATKGGDFTTAQNQLRALRRSYPEIPFDSLVRLPLRIETTPPGATILINGKDAGLAPLVASYVPGQESKVTVRLNGFLAEETTIRGDEVALVRSLLARKPLWTATLAGSVERQVATDGKKIVYAVDRGGTLTAFDLERGTNLWHFASGDISGLLSTPVVAQSVLVLTSADGILRAFDRTTGKPRWDRQKVPSAVAPAVVGNTVLVGTSDGSLLAYEPEQGVQVWRLPLPGAVEAPLVTFDGRVVAATAAGDLICVRVNDAAESWRVKLEAGVDARMVQSGDLIFVATKDGSVSAVHRHDGRRVWTRRGLGMIEVGLAMAHDRLLVAIGEKLLVLRPGDGNTTREWSNSTPITGDPVATGRDVYLGGRDGVVSVIDQETLELRHRLRGQKGAYAPVLVVGGRVVVGFEDRTLHCYSER